MATPILIWKNLQIDISEFFQMYWASYLGPSSICQTCLFGTKYFYLSVIGRFLRLQQFRAAFFQTPNFARSRDLRGQSDDPPRVTNSLPQASTLLKHPYSTFG